MGNADMPGTMVAEYVAQLQGVQDEILSELASMETEELRYATDSPRWNSVRRVMLRFGDHLREHTTQLVAAREAIGATQTMPQRMLARSMEAVGALHGALVGLDDSDLDESPEPGEWSPRQVLEHMIEVQAMYLEMVRSAREQSVSLHKD